VLGDSMGWTAVNIGLLALAVFGFSFLAALWWRLLGARVLLIVSVVGVGLTRLALQLWPDMPLAYLLLCIVGTVCLVLFFPVYLAALRPREPADMIKFGYGLQIGFILSVLFNGLYNSYEFNWQPGWPNALLAVVLVFLQLGCLAGVLSQLPSARQDQDAPFKSALLWAMIGPFIFLQLLIFLNIAQIGAATGWTLPVAFALALLAGVVGLGGAMFTAARGIGLIALLIESALLLALAVNPINISWLTAVLLLLGQFVLGTILMVVLLNLQTGDGRPSTIRNLSVGNGIGWVLFVVFVFLYYAGYTLPLMDNAILPPIATLLVVSAGLAANVQLPKAARQHPTLVRGSLIILGVVLLAAVTFKFLTWKTPEPVAPTGDPVRVLTYNLHNGVNPYGQLDLEAIAQAIEAENPDVIALQEVSRGWLVNGSADMLQWLSQRLEMPYVWGTTEGLTWGNAVFSRYPIIATETHALPTEDLLLHRGFIWAQIEVGTAEPLNIIDTHYHQLADGTDIRVLQTEAILDFWNGRPHTLIVGDLNAFPNTPEMAMLQEAGFTDALTAAGIIPGYTYFSLAPDRRLDYIWYTADLTATDVLIAPATASDHLGVAATISGE